MLFGIRMPKPSLTTELALEACILGPPMPILGPSPSSPRPRPNLACDACPITAIRFMNALIATFPAGGLTTGSPNDEF